MTPEKVRCRPELAHTTTVTLSIRPLTTHPLCIYSYDSSPNRLKLTQPNQTRESGAMLSKLPTGTRPPLPRVRLSDLTSMTKLEFSWHLTLSKFRLPELGCFCLSDWTLTDTSLGPNLITWNNVLCLALSRGGELHLKPCLIKILVWLLAIYLVRLAWLTTFEWRNSVI